MQRVQNRVLLGAPSVFLRLQIAVPGALGQQTSIAASEETARAFMLKIAGLNIDKLLAEVNLRSAPLDFRVLDTRVAAADAAAAAGTGTGTGTGTPKLHTIIAPVVCSTGKYTAVDADPEHVGVTESCELCPAGRCEGFCIWSLLVQ
jgi:hypothetical protein